MRDVFYDISTSDATTKYGFSARKLKLFADNNIIHRVKRGKSWFYISVELDCLVKYFADVEVGLDDRGLGLVLKEYYDEHEPGEQIFERKFWFSWFRRRNKI